MLGVASNAIFGQWSSLWYPGVLPGVFAAPGNQLVVVVDKFPEAVAVDKLHSVDSRVYERYLAVSVGGCGHLKR
jgi:hypothetical protein